MLVIPICLKCAHCESGMVCKAFPKGIPKELLLGEKDLNKICKSFEKLEFKKAPE